MSNPNVRKIFLSFPARSPTSVMMLYIITALLAFVAFIVWMVFDQELLRQPFAQGLRLFGAIHLLSLGWITMMMIGVYYNLIPVILHFAKVSPAFGRYLFFLYAPGVGLFVWGFTFASRYSIGIGATMLAVALIVHGIQFGWSTFRRLRSDELLPVSIGFFLAFIFLIETALIGLLMSFTVTGFLPSSLLSLLPLHMVAALGGWLGMTIMGASYRLVPLFFDVFPRDLRPRWASNTIV